VFFAAWLAEGVSALPCVLWVRTLFAVVQNIRNEYSASYKIAMVLACSELVRLKPRLSVGTDVGCEMMALTARKVETAAPGRYVDGRGLMLVVKPSGAKSWVLRYQLNGRRRDMGLGPLS
jgi:predicted RNase H-related nuclease YkuK (DUF458 family)